MEEQNNVPLKKETHIKKKEKKKISQAQWGKCEIKSDI